MYWIKEIFYSIQGEGRWTGLPAIFIRFAGCNLSCTWCDTDWSNPIELSLDNIINEIKKYPTKHIILTGGEPTLQLDKRLIKTLKKNGYYLHIESNGTKCIPRGINWTTISPKQNSNWIIKRGDELKVVYEGQDLKQYEDTKFKCYYLQPCSMKNTEETVEVCKKNPKWNLSIQTQKLLNIR
jgi:organic radical activating enzyme